jgi:hypothetical protein
MWKAGVVRQASNQYVSLNNEGMIMILYDYRMVEVGAWSCGE